MSQGMPAHIALFGRVLSPACYLTQIVLGELRWTTRCKDYTTQWHEPHELPTTLQALSPYAIMPVLLLDHNPIVGIDAIIGWLFDRHDNDDMQQLCPQDTMLRAEMRHVCQLYHQRFAHDVAAPLFEQKIVTFFTRQTPDASLITLARRNLHKSYLPYLEHLTAEHAYLVGQDLSLADLTVAAYLCCVDYQGEISWGAFPNLAAWYQRMKSRQSFSPLLKLSLSRCPPSRHFATLDDDD